MPRKLLSFISIKFSSAKIIATCEQIMLTGENFSLTTGIYDALLVCTIADIILICLFTVFLILPACKKCCLKGSKIIDRLLDGQ